MATIVPPPASPPPPPPPAPPPAAVVLEAPPALVRLPAGTELPAIVAARPQAGQAVVATELGEVLLQTKLPLPPNAQLLLQVAKVAPQFELLIKTVNGVSTTTGRPVPVPAVPGQSPAPAPGQAAAENSAPAPAPPSLGGALDAAARPTAGAAPADTVQLGATLKATVVRAIAPTVTTPLPGATTQSATAPASGAVPATPAPATATSQTPPAPQTSTAPAGSSPPAAPAAQTPVSASQPTRPFAPPAGSEVTVRLLSVSTAGQRAVPPAPSGPAAQVVTGTVTGATPAGVTLLQTPTAVLALPTQTPLPQSAEVTLEVVGQSRPATAALPAGGFERIYLARDWPSLDEALATLSHSAPAAAQQIATTVIPRADNLLTANILIFLAALRGGDVRSWIGDAAVRVLERDRPELGGRLADDFTQLSRAFNEPGAGDWRTALVPFFNGQQLEQVRMHTRGQKDDEDQTETTRFIVDVEMTRLGRVQLDGLVNAKGKRFDLIVRSARAFTPEMRQDIYKIFTDATEATGITGNLVFQADSRFVDVDAIGEARRPRLLV